MVGTVISSTFTWTNGGTRALKSHLTKVTWLINGRAMSPMQGSMAPEPCADHNISLPLKIQNMTMCVCFHSKACEAHLFIEFSRQEYGCGLPFPPPGIFPTQGLNRHLLCLLHWQADSLPLSHLGIQPPSSQDGHFPAVWPLANYFIGMLTSFSVKWE